MIRRSWRYVLAGLVVLALILGGGYWYWNRPAPQPTLEQLPQADGSSMTRVTPGTTTKARVVVAVMADASLTDHQLIALSQGGSAQIVQVILPKEDCKLQEQALQAALGQLKGPATLVSGIGPGAGLAWRWLATQNDDKANAISVGFALVQEGCTDPLPKTACCTHSTGPAWRWAAP